MISVTELSPRPIVELTDLEGRLIAIQLFISILSCIFIVIIQGESPAGSHSWPGSPFTIRLDDLSLQISRGNLSVKASMQLHVDNNYITDTAADGLEAIHHQGSKVRIPS